MTLFLENNFSDLFLAVSGLRCFLDFSLVLASGGQPLVVGHRPLCGVWAPGCAGSIAAASGPGSSEACGSFPDQGLNPSLLRWQVNSLPLSHQGSPDYSMFMGQYCDYFGIALNILYVHRTSRDISILSCH